jgi:hypothetical protein
MTYPPNQPSQPGGYNYDPYGDQSGSQPNPQPGGYNPQPQQPGYPAPQMPPPAMGPQYGAPGVPAGGQPQNGMGTAALVLGILGLLCGGVLAILAIIFGAIGVSKANKGLATNKGAATAGLIMGIIGIAWGFVFWLAIYPSMVITTY